MLRICLLLTIYLASNSGEVVEIPFDARPSVPIALKGSMGGRNVRLLLSTTVTELVLKPSHLSARKVPKFMISGDEITAAGFPLYRLPDADEIVLFGRKSNSVPYSFELACEVDVSHLEPLTGEFDGILGTNWMYVQPFTLDFERSTLYLNKRTSGDITRVKRLENTFVFAASSRDLPLEFGLDLLSGSTELGARTFDTLLARGEIQLLPEVESLGHRHASVVPAGVLKVLTVFGRQFHDVDVVRGSTNLVGTDILRNFTICFDLPRDVLLTTELKTTRYRRSAYCAFGLAFFQGNDGTIITKSEKGLGYRLGVRSGHVVTKLNDLTKFDHFDVYQTLFSLRGVVAFRRPDGTEYELNLDEIRQGKFPPQYDPAIRK